MTRRIIITIALALVALLAGTSAALAGGWAIVTLDQLPQDVRAGQSTQIGFVVRQHGKTPTNIGLDGQRLSPMVTITQAGDAKPIAFPARQTGATGHFVADITFPRAGEWEWAIANLGYFIQEIPGGDGMTAQLAPLTVLPAIAPPAAAEPLAPSLAGATLLRWAGVALLLAALLALVLGQRVRTARRAAADNTQGMV